MIEFTVDGEPASKSRARFTGRGSKVRAFTPERTRQAEEQVAAAYLRAAGRLNKADVSTAYSVTAEFHLKRNQRRDVDNMLKLVLDGLNEVAWADDSQVIEIAARKVYNAGLGKTVVTIREAGTIPRSVATCEQCGGEFPRPPSHSAKKFCSDACRRAARLARVTRQCPQCGSAFIAKEKGQVHCSRPCSDASKNVDVECVECGRAFTKPRSLMRSGNHYCSEDCKRGYWSRRRRSEPKGTCRDCGGPTTKATYQRCRDCSYAAGGRHAHEGGAA